MDTSKEEVQRNKFRDILFELASNQELLKDKSVRAKIPGWRLSTGQRNLKNRSDIFIPIFSLC